MGDSPIHYRGHVRMMAAVQPFLSGAISKTVNMPEEATVEDIEKLYVEGWRLGLKNLAIYRDNCKVGQPLSADKKKIASPSVPGAPVPVTPAPSAPVTPAPAAAPAAGASPKPVRRRLPRSRPSRTVSFRIADCDGYVTAGEYPDDHTLGEIFLKVAKQGSTLAGIMDAFAISVSMGLQYGVPLKAYVEKFVNMRFEPSGVTDDPDFRFCASLLDYVFRRLGADYLSADERQQLNVLSTEERQRSLDGGVPATTNGKHHSQEQSLSVHRPSGSDAPMCYTCGVHMQPAGSCFVCGSCGTTSGCS
jgi:ribonucleoside-diphosphate reductase alpha chain